MVLLAFSFASQNIVNANGQSDKDTTISNGITQQYRQNIRENIEKRLENAVNDSAAIHRLLHQEQYVKINSLVEAQLQGRLY
jgi:hypothetical protein